MCTHACTFPITHTRAHTHMNTLHLTHTYTPHHTHVHDLTFRSGLLPFACRYASITCRHQARHALALKGLTVRLAELSNRADTRLSFSGLYCKCFRNINSFGPRGLNDEVNVIVLIDRYYYCFLTDENTANKEVTQAVWHQNLYFCPHSKLSLWS